MYVYLRFTPVFLLNQLHKTNAINFFLNLAPRQLCSPSGQDLTGSCVDNELAVPEACLDVFGSPAGLQEACGTCPSVVQRIKLGPTDMCGV